MTSKSPLTLEIVCAAFDQGVWNRREIQLTRPALPYDYTTHIHIQMECPSAKHV